MNVLFVCSRNQWRSPTAQRHFSKGWGIHTRSAGTAKAARHRVSLADIEWADMILVMEAKHRTFLLKEFSGGLNSKDLLVLDIPDDYKYMDPELIEELEGLVPEILEDFGVSFQ